VVSADGYEVGSRLRIVVAGKAEGVTARWIWRGAGIEEHNIIVIVIIGLYVKLGAKIFGGALRWRGARVDAGRGEPRPYKGLGAGGVGGGGWFLGEEAGEVALL
jgi:hypothetical protein